jgi:hypothetical protein
MDRNNPRDHIEAPEPAMRATYVRVIIVEIIVLVALWIFGRAFSA